MFGLYIGFVFYFHQTVWLSFHYQDGPKMDCLFSRLELYSCLQTVVENCCSK